MGASWLCARSGMRHTIGATIALVALAGVAGAVVLAALAGAHRSDTAFDRFMTATRGPDAIFQPQSDDELEQISNLPEVSAVAPLWFMAVAPHGLSPEQGGGAFAGSDGRFGYRINRPVVLHGRLADPRRVDEVTMNEVMARRLGLRVGDRVTLDGISPEQFQAQSSGERATGPAGPRVRVRVVGIVASFLDLATNAGSPAMYPTAAFFERYQDRIASSGPIVLVDLSHDEQDLPALQRGLHAAAGDGPTSDFGTRKDLSIDFDQAAGVQARALLIFAVLAALAGMLAVGQALSRHLARTVPDRLTTAALGMTRRQRFAIGVLETLPVALGGALVAVPLAVAASPLLPIGLSRQAEPHPGVAFDALIVLTGALIVGLVILGRGALSAWALARRATTASATTPPSKICASLARNNAPPPTVAGVGMALPRQPPPMGPAARSALLAGVAGTALLVGILTFSASLDRLVSTPARYGAPYDQATTDAVSGRVAHTGARALADRPGVGSVTVLGRAAITALGHQAAAASVQGIGGPPRITVTRGRLPAADDEVFMGPSVLRNLGLHVGQPVPLAGHPFTIVGYGLIPVLGDVDASKTAVFTRAGLRAAQGQVQDYYLWFDDHSPHDEATTWANAHVGRTAPPAPPPVVRNLADIDRMPLLLALFVGFLAVAALMHATVTTVRWRRRDLAVLRVIGFAGRQVRSTVRWQAWVPVLLGLVVGLPVGIAIGRWIWVLVAHGPGAPDDAFVPVAALVLLVPAALLFAALVAALPGRSAARIRPAVALRAE